LSGVSTYFGMGVWIPLPHCDLGVLNGTAGACCDADCQFEPASTVCRAALDSCDIDETCSGLSASCPADVYEPDASACSDGEACNGVDQCLSGVCTSGGSLPDGTACDDGEACTAGDSCVGGVCASGATLLDGSACDDGNPCRSGQTCASGVCGHGTAAPNGTLCDDDDNDCTGVGTCKSGACKFGAIADGTPCDDGESCTAGAVCLAAECLGVGVLPDATACQTGASCTSAGSCTSGVCTGTAAEPDGTECDDGNACSLADECFAGECVSSKPAADGATCDDDESCTSNDACMGGECRGDVSPQLCRVPIAAGKAQITVKDKPAGRKDKLIWKWSKGEATAFSEWGNPDVDTDYALCVYQPGLTHPLLSLTAPAGGTCGTRPCWDANASNGKIAYKDRDLTPDGVQTIKLSSSTTPGRAKAIFKAKGVLLALPSPPFNAELRVELRNSTSALCWGADHPTVLKDEVGQHKAKGP
jgi:Disintegrin